MKSYNAVQSFAASLTLGYQILFDTVVNPDPSNVPKVVSLTFEGITVCTNENEVTTTTTATTTMAGSKMMFKFVF
jgi:hypothetical protein